MLRPTIHRQPLPPNPRLQPHVAIVSAKLGRRRRRPSESVDPSEALAPTAEPTTTAISEHVKEEEAPDEGPAEWRSGGSLSGSDVLMAMRRAAAAQRGKKKKRERRPAKGGGELEGDGGEARPLTIGSDWGSRLEEMDRALHHLLQLHP